MAVVTMGGGWVLAAEALRHGLAVGHIVVVAEQQSMIWLTGFCA
jgi:hypothetical protein